MTIAICDDDKEFCLKVKEYVEEFIERKKLTDIDIIIFNSGEDIMAYKNSVDIALMDVEMNGISGIHAGRELRKLNSKIIIIVITSYNEYLDEALRYNAFRYISKPLDKHRLHRNLTDAVNAYTTHCEKIVIDTEKRTEVVMVSDIIMLETKKRNVIIYTTHGPLTSPKTMHYWAETLAHTTFFQSHKSYLINLEHVLSFDKENIYLTGDLHAFLTARKHTDFKKAYLQFIDIMN